MLLQHIDHLWTADDTLGEIADAAVVVQDNVIVWVGDSCDIPDQYLTDTQQIDLSGHIVTPGKASQHNTFAYVGRVLGAAASKTTSKTPRLSLLHVWC
jgi:predicted amidohydrolase YtcJ